MSKAKEILEQLPADKVNEAEHQYTPHLDAMHQHLMNAKGELHKMLDMKHNGVVAPSEIDKMTKLHHLVKNINKLMKDGYKL